jgi:hypothetical protein
VHWGRGEGRERGREREMGGEERQMRGWEKKKEDWVKRSEEARGEYIFSHLWSARHVIYLSSKCMFHVLCVRSFHSDTQ